MYRNLVTFICWAICMVDICLTTIPIPVEDVRLDLRKQATKDHILEDLQHQINTKNKEEMSPRELQFHYFKLHDYDNNNLLDGLEIVKAIKHQHEEHASEGEDSSSTTNTSDEELIRIVDGVMDMDDLDKDGFVSFYEFMSNQPDNADVDG